MLGKSAKEHLKLAQQAVEPLKKESEFLVSEPSCRRVHKSLNRAIHLLSKVGCHLESAGSGRTRIEQLKRARVVNQIDRVFDAIDDTFRRCLKK